MDPNNINRYNLFGPFIENSMVCTFIEALGFSLSDAMSVRKLCKATGIPSKKIKYYQESHILPDHKDLEVITKKTGVSELDICLQMGIYPQRVRELLASNSKNISRISPNLIPKEEANNLDADFETDFGTLYQSDCLNVLPTIESDSIDMVFADPPFNLDKFYGNDIDDKMNAVNYDDWCQRWLDECIRVLKPGGSIFIWHIPKWAQRISAYLDQFLEFRHWISVKMNYGLPIFGKLYPAHYSLLYFTKSKKPSTFKPDRVPIETCRHCASELKDYGGHKNKLNPMGLNLQDVWLDINPVKHNKKRSANELPLNLLDRIIQMSTLKGDVVLDPFIGSGVSGVVSELKGRKWIGCELGDISPILSRFDDLSDDKKKLDSYRNQTNKLFLDPIREMREDNQIWTQPPSNSKNKIQVPLHNKKTACK